jgi:hypothetical protein
MVISLMAYDLIQRICHEGPPDDAHLRERRITTRTLPGEFRNDTLLIHHQHPGWLRPRSPD